MAVQEAAIAFCVAAGSALALFFCSRAAARFREHPDPGRAASVRVFGMLSSAAVLAFYGGVVVFGLATIAAPTIAWLGRHGHADSSRLPVIGVFLLALPAAAVLRARLERFASRAFSRAGDELAEVPRAPNAGASLPHFAVMQYYALILNRTYKMFIAPTMLCGAKVLGIVANPSGTSEAMLDPEYWTGTMMATLYDGLDVTSREFLRLNGANFQIAWRDITSVEFNSRRKWGMGNVPHSGRIVLRLVSGRSCELILLGTQDGEALRARLESAASA
jgi:hypothetical protein